MNMGGSIFLVTLLLFAAFFGLGVVITQNSVLRAENHLLTDEVDRLKSATVTESLAKEEAEAIVFSLQIENLNLLKTLENERTERNQCLVELDKFRAGNDMLAEDGGVLAAPVQFSSEVQTDNQSTILILFLATIMVTVGFVLLSALIIINRNRVVKKIFGSQTLGKSRSRRL